MGLLTFKADHDETLTPDERQVGDIFARLGYRFTDAIADLVDNSVDATSKNVHIRFVRSERGIHSVVIADNGMGMTSEELKEAMRFGSHTAKTKSQLGKYGIGLKSASLSQADKVTVLTRQGKSFNGRRWALEKVKTNWSCEVLNTSDVRKAFDITFGEFTINKSGTIVIWEELEHLKALPTNVDQVLTRTTKDLSTELGIRFHRFIEDQRLAISTDQQIGFEEPGDLPLYITALDPFGYEHPPRADYPVRLPLAVGGTRFVAECHIWPPKSNATGYKLGGGKVALRQGFYFYRNDRIIQAGGWNQMRADDSEPHFSLARVRIDLPASLDSQFKLDVTKSRLDPGPEFITAIGIARSKDGVTFAKYLDHAEGAYRKQKTKERAQFPLIPGSGISVKAQNAIATILKEQGAVRPTKVSFKWSRLDPDEIVRIAPGEPEILLNSRFRAQLAEGNSNDAPVLKTVLMFLLQEEIGKSFVTKISIARIQKMNQAMIASLKE